MKLKIFNVVDHTELTEMTVEKIPVQGDPVEIDSEMYFVCETGSDETDNSNRIGVIPLVIRNPRKLENLGSYIKCLSAAHRRVQFRKKNNICDLNDCDEMVIS